MAPMGELYSRGNVRWMSFTDFRGVRRRLPAGSSLRAAKVFQRHVEHLNECAATATPPDITTTKWINVQPKKTVDRLIGISLISERSLVAHDNLDVQLDRWEDAVLARGRTTKYAKDRRNLAHRLLSASGAEYFADIDPEKVIQQVADWRRDNTIPGRPELQRTRDVSESTLASHLSAAKGFCRWMWKAQYVAEDPLKIVSIQRSPARKQLDRPSPAAVRRPLTVDEQRQLVQGTPSLPPFRGVSGVERSRLYRVGLQTGLRPKHIRSVFPRHIDPAGYLVPTATAYNKRCSPKQLKPALLADLLALAGDADPDAPLLHAPRPDAWAKMLRRDCEELGIDTHGVDFYSLRHSFATVMVSQGVLIKQLADLLDDSIEMVSKFYTHSFTGDLARAMDGLPDLDASPEDTGRRELA